MLDNAPPDKPGDPRLASDDWQRRYWMREENVTPERVKFPEASIVAAVVMVLPLVWLVAYFLARHHG